MARQDLVNQPLRNMQRKSLGLSISILALCTGGIALKCIQWKIDLNSSSEIDKILNQTKFEFGREGGSVLFMDGVDITSEITSTQITALVSQVSAIPKVREKLVQYQRDMAKGLNVVLEGRDIGTVVFPDAEFKFFLIADITERAWRRKQEM